MTPEQYVCHKETMQEIHAALMLCTESQRRRFLLYALEDMSLAEIGRVCGCSKASVFESIEAVRKKVKIFRGYRDKSTKRYGWEVVAVTDPNILGLVDLTR